MEDHQITVKKLVLTQFRNYSHQDIDFSPKINVLMGQNGMGKTNVLDALYMLCLGKSYFNAIDNQIIMHNCDFYRIGSIIEVKENKDKVTIKSQLGKRKEIEISGKKIIRLKDHIGQFPAVIVAPDDIHHLLNTSEERRNFINNTLVQLDGQYLEDLATYTQLLKQRNAALKHFQETKIFNASLLDAISEGMYKPAQNIFQKRKVFIDEISPLFFEIYNEISGENEKSTLKYESTLSDNDLKVIFTQALEKDKILGRTTQGIHKDDLNFMMDALPLKTFASQGQLKSYILALKIAQYHYLRKKKQLKPILMLDDIFDKLDPLRVRQLINIVSTEEFGQVFITDTQKDRIHNILEDIQTPHKMLEVHKGQIF